MAIAAAAAPLLIVSDPIVVLVAIRPGLELGGVLTIWIDGHSGDSIVVFVGLRTDSKPGNVNEALVLLYNIGDATNNDEKATE